MKTNALQLYDRGTICLEHVPDLHGKGGLVDRDILRGRLRAHFLSSHDSAHVSTGSFFSRYI